MRMSYSNPSARTNRPCQPHLISRDMNLSETGNLEPCHTSGNELLIRLAVHDLQSGVCWTILRILGGTLQLRLERSIGARISDAYEHISMMLVSKFLCNTVQRTFGPVDRMIRNCILEHSTIFSLISQRHGRIQNRESSD